MGTNTKQFQADLNKFVNEEIPREIKRRQIECMVFLWKAVRARTPVLTEHAKRNWRITLGMIPRGELGKRYSNSPGGTTAVGPSEEQIRNQMGMLPLGSSVQGFGNKGRSALATLFNNVSYMQALADGHSSQAPAGYIIEGAMDELRTFIATKGW